MPPQIPKPEWMVAISGIAEIFGGIGLLLPATQIAARWGLIALLVCVFPANVFMATHQISPTGRPIPPALLWARLPLQPLLMWWIFVATIPSSKRLDSRLVGSSSTK